MKNKSKINIIFPYNSVGGAFRSTYEIGNRLTNLGYEVVVYFPFFPLMKGRKLFSIENIFFFIRGIGRSLIRRNKVIWFDVNFKVKIVPFLNDFFIENADIVIANHWVTAENVYRLSKNKGEKYYFIRDIEHWSPHFEYVKDAFKLDMKRLVVADWIKDYLKKELDLSAEAVITNGLNFKIFKVEDKKYNLKNVTISMIFSSHPMKGIEDAVYVLEKIYKKYPDIKIILFGFEPKPKNLNFKFTYLRGLAGSSVKEVYTKSDIFLSTSIQEGFNNPPSEAMAAKCAVLATKVGSSPHTTEHMINGILVEPRDTAKMEKFLSLLIEDRDLRISLSENGFKSIQKLTWDVSIKKLDNLFSKTYAKEL